MATTFLMASPLQFWNGSAFAYDGDGNPGEHLAEDGDMRLPGYMLATLAAIPVPSAVTWQMGGNPFVALSFSDSNVVLPPPGGLFSRGFD